MTTDRETWLAQRREGIGATDIAAIAGVHPYKTAMDVYLEKVEGREADLTGNASVEWGNRLEDAIKEKYEEVHGVDLVSPGLIVHPNRDWMRATPDRVVVGRKKAVELKTAGAHMAHRWGEPGTAEFPEEYQIQAAWQLAVLDYDEADVAALIGGSDYREYPVARDRELEADLIQIGEEFWRRHVLERMAPELDGSEATAAYLAGRYPRAVNPLLPADPDADELVRVYREAQERVDAAEADKARAKHRLMAIIGDHDGIEGPWGKVYWRAQKGRPVWKAIAEELGVTPELIAKHTPEGARVFRPYWKKGS